MKRYTKKEKQLKLKQLEGLIEKHEERLSFIEDYSVPISEANKKIQRLDYKLSIIEKSLCIKLPHHISEIIMIDNSIKTYKEAEAIKKGIWGKFEIIKNEVYSLTEKEGNCSNHGSSLTLSLDAIKNSKEYYTSNLTSVAMIYQQIAMDRAKAQMELFTDYTSEQRNLTSKLEKHIKQLEKLSGTKTYSSQQITKVLKDKNDYQVQIEKTEIEIEKRYKILKEHINQYYSARYYRDCLSKDLNNINIGQYTPDNEEVFKRSYDRYYINYEVGQGKRRGWIKKSIIQVRKLREKLDKQFKVYEKYLLESGSEGEKYIRKYLTDKDISFEEQKRFEGCFDKSTLPFDFFIPHLNLLIEYDGAQHYMAVEIYGGEEGFKDRQKKDSIKSIWADDNGYQLVRIRYDEEIEEALELLL